MFAAKHPSLFRPFLCDLCSLCVEKTLQLLCRESPAECAQPLPSFSTASKHRARRNACIPRIFLRFRTLSVTTGVGGLITRSGTGIPACLRPTVAQVSACACSGAPVQSHWPVHRMHHRRTRPPRLQQIRLQPEIPLRRPVRIIDQHQPRVVLQPFGLQDHRLLVLPQKFLRKYSENPNGHQQVPRRHEINPAKIAPHRRHRRPARKPQLPAPNLFRPDIWQNKIDRRSNRLTGVFLQHPVRRAVRARRVWAHPKTIRNRFKLFFFFVNAMPAAPVPRLMHKRPVRRVHQSNNPLVHMRRQLASQMRHPIFLAESRQFRYGRNRLGQSRSRGAQVYPEISVAFLARIMPSKNAFDFEFVLASQRWNFYAPPRTSLKFPPMITALQRMAVKAPVGKRNPPVRARITHRKCLPLSRAPEDKRHFQQHRSRQPVAANFRAPQSRIPEIPQKSDIIFVYSFARCCRASLYQGLHRFTHR